MFAPRYFAPHYFAPRFWPPGFPAVPDDGVGTGKRKKKKYEDIPRIFDIPERETVAESMQKAIKRLETPKGNPSGRKAKSAAKALREAEQLAESERVRRNMAETAATLETASVSAAAARDILSELRAEIALQRRLQDDEDAIIVLLMN